MLTKRQKQILDFIQERTKKSDVSPTLEEIAKHFRLSSLATVHQHVAALEKKGYLKRHPRQARAIELLNPAGRLVTLRLLGSITAGDPIEQYEIPETMQVPKSFLAGSGNHFALKVEGDSMIDEGIFDGDVVVVREQPVAETGETIVAITEDGATLKKYYNDDGKIRLQPANPNMKPIFPKEIVIQGKVTSVIRSLK